MKLWTDLFNLPLLPGASSSIDSSLTVKTSSLFFRLNRLLYISSEIHGLDRTDFAENKKASFNSDQNLFQEGLGPWRSCLIFSKDCSTGQSIWACLGNLRGSEKPWFASSLTTKSAILIRCAVHTGSMILL